MSRTSNTQAVGTVGRVLSDKTLLEMVYDPKHEKGFLLVKLPSGAIEKVSRFQDPMTGTIYEPMVDNKVRNGLITLPSELGDEVTITTLFDKTCSFIYKFMDMDEDTISIAASFAIMSHVYDRFEKVPYLRFFGTYSTGKSRALAIMQELCYHSLNLGTSQTTPNIFRTMEQLGTGTLFLDEMNFADTSNSSDITKILNCGNCRNGVVYRCDPKDNTPNPYRIYSPKVIANHTSYDDPALESRMFTITMKPSSRLDVRKPLPNLFNFGEAKNLQNLMLRYRFDHYWTINTDQIFDELAVFDARTRDHFTHVMGPGTYYGSSLCD